MDGVGEKGYKSFFCHFDIIHQFCRKFHAGSNDGTEKRPYVLK